MTPSRSRSTPLRARVRASAAWCPKWAVAGLGLLVLASPARGQSMAPPLVPRGHVRLDFGPSFTSWHQRYGLDDSGDVVEHLGEDLSDPTGKRLFPGLATLEESLRSLSGDGAFQAALGHSTTQLTYDVKRLDWGLRVGVFDWLTVGAVAPYVKARTALDLHFRPDTAVGLGLNPYTGAEGDVTSLLESLAGAATSAAQLAASVCAQDPGDPCAQAQALSSRASEFSGLARVAYEASPFFPALGSPVAMGLQGALDALDAQLAAAGLAPVGADMVFAESRLDAASLAEVASLSGFSALELGSLDGVWSLGDVELLADVRLLHHDPAEEGRADGVAFTVSGGVTVRLPTGTVDDPDVFLDIGSGDGQLDVEGRADGRFRFGRWAALHAGARYGVQRERTLLRRVAPHERVFVPLDRTRAVKWSPGAYLFVEVSPRLRLSEDLSMAFDYRLFHKAADEFSLASTDESAEPVDVSVLARESEVTLRQVGVGLRYSTRVSWILDRAGAPVDVGARWIGAIGGSGGRTPKASRLELSISLYRRIWDG